jgi:hypothetical protein
LSIGTAGLTCSFFLTCLCRCHGKCTAGPPLHLFGWNSHDYCTPVANPRDICIQKAT